MNTLFIAQAAVSVALMLWMAIAPSRSASGFCIQLAASAACLWAAAWLGAVGNSGNTGEPHLHVHAQRPGPAGAPIAGDPLPIQFDGCFPVRGDRIGSP